MSQLSSEAGAGRWGSVFDRLYDPVTYTGVYAERFKSGPGINHDSEAKVHLSRSTFAGNTNEGSDEVVRDIRFITRPNLNRDRTGPLSPVARAAFKARLRYQAAEEALEQLMRAGEAGHGQGGLLEAGPHAAGGGGSPSVYVMRASDAGASGAESDAGSAAHSGAGAAPEPLPLDTNLLLSLLFQCV
jgi:hypothetical protein